MIERVLPNQTPQHGEEIGWMEAIRKNPAGPNPFVYGEARFARYIDIMTE